MSTPGATELLLVLVIVLLILGPKRLPSLGRQLGGGIREFRKSISGSKSDHTEDSAPGAAKASPVTSETVDGDVVPERRHS